MDRSFILSPYTSMHNAGSPSFPFPPSELSAPSSAPHVISPQGCLHPSTVALVVCRVYSPGTILSCRAERVVKLSTPDRTNQGASSSKTQRFDVGQYKRAYDPRPVATDDALRHERAARRGLPQRGATSGAYMLHWVVLAEVAGGPCKETHLSY